MKPIDTIFSHIPTAIPVNRPDFGICSKKLMLNQKKMKQDIRPELNQGASKETASFPH